jgi:hypothetical protein
MQWPKQCFEEHVRKMVFLKCGRLMAAIWNTGRLALVAVIGLVCGLCFYVDYAPCVAPMAWTVLPLCCSMLASMAWTMWFFYGLNYAFAYACFYGTSMGHNTWYLVPCNSLSLRNMVVSTIGALKY